MCYSIWSLWEVIKRHLKSHVIQLTICENYMKSIVIPR